MQAIVDVSAQLHSCGFVEDVPDGGVDDSLSKSAEQIESLAARHRGRRFGKRDVAPFVFGVGEKRGANVVLGYVLMARSAHLGRENIPAAFELRIRDDVCCAIW